MDIKTATKEQLTTELKGVLETLLAVINTGRVPNCLEKTNAVYYLNKHRKLILDEFGQRLK